MSDEKFYEIIHEYISQDPERSNKIGFFAGNMFNELDEFDEKESINAR